MPEAAREEHRRRVGELTAERDDARNRVRAYVGVINGVRRSLGVAPEAPDASLARRVGELTEQVAATQGAITSYQDTIVQLRAQRDRLAQGNEGMVATIREVREALKVAPETRDVDLASVVRGWRAGSAEPVPTATPEHLAQVLFVTAREVSRTRGSEPMPIIEKSGWDEAHPNRRRWWLEVAGQALAQLRIVPSVSLLPVTAEEAG